jgi:diadenosine tetraphosphatase ApaH/serine/threonine PP2A family protein phosphatase
VRYLILSDLHANAHALEAVLADALSRGYDQVLVLGDLVGYGAEPGVVIDRTLALEPVAMIRGNHDKVCAGLEPAVDFNDVARQSVEWTAAQLSPSQQTVLETLRKGPYRVITDLEICHGAPFDEDYYIFDNDDAARAIDATSARICLFGHTHLPGVFVTDNVESREAASRDDERMLPARGQVLINVGSVGQPRDRDPRAAYGILDTDRNTLILARVAYDIAGAQARIREAGLPEWLALRLEKGQ